MRTEETAGMIRDALKKLIPLFTFTLLMFGIGMFIVNYFNLPMNLPTTAQQLPSLDWRAIYFSPGIIVFGVFAVTGMFPLLFYLLYTTIFKGWLTSISDKESRGKEQ